MIKIGKNLDKSENASLDIFLEKVILVLNDKNNKEPFEATPLLWNKFEIATKDAMELVKSHNTSECYSNWNIELVSGGRFPDIVGKIALEKCFGVEVKTSQNQSWKTLGGSIMESTRVDFVDRINVLFAKLNPFEIRTKRFEDVISDVAVTHSPRYLIDFEIDPSKTIFKQIGVSYDDVWQSEKPFDYFRNHFIKKAKKNGSELWFISTKENETEVEDFPSYEIKFFSDFSKEQRQEYIIKMMILFPEIFKAHAGDVYKRIAIWLLKSGILNPSLRDMFSASGHVSLHGYEVPSKFERLHVNISEIYRLIKGKTIPLDIRTEYDSSDCRFIMKKWKLRVLEAVKYDSNIRQCVLKIFKAA